MRWTIEEDEMCCRAVVDEYVINRRHMHVDTLITWIMKNPQMQHGAGIVRMRIQNIKSILDEWNVPNTLNISPLKHAGQQTRTILKAIIDEQNIEIPLV